MMRIVTQIPQNKNKLINLNSRQDSSRNLTYESLGLGKKYESMMRLIGYTMIIKTWIILD